MPAINFLTTPEIKAKLEELAAYHNRSQINMIVTLILRAYDRMKEEEKQ